MASRALREWRTTCATVLDEIDAAHATVRGPARGRRAATLRLTHAYVLLLSAQFQRFCRELHSEAYASALREQTITQPLRHVLLLVLTTGRALDRGNPSPDNIDRDFRPICGPLWQQASTRNPRSNARRRKLEQLNAWRNAIAHHDFTKANAPTERLTLGSVRSWRRACNGLATTFDGVASAALRQLVGRSPW